MISLVASLVALLATPALAQHRRDRHGDRTQINIDIDGDRETRRERRHRRIRRPVSSVPEPSAALLFAGGGLIVAQAIRTNRRKKR